MTPGVTIQTSLGEATVEAVGPGARYVLARVGARTRWFVRHGSEWRERE